MLLPGAARSSRPRDLTQRPSQCNFPRETLLALPCANDVVVAELEIELLRTKSAKKRKRAFKVPCPPPPSSPATAAHTHPRSHAQEFLQNVVAAAGESEAADADMHAAVDDESVLRASGAPRQARAAAAGVDALSGGSSGRSELLRRLAADAAEEAREQGTEAALENLASLFAGVVDDDDL